MKKELSFKRIDELNVNDYLVISKEESNNDDLIEKKNDFISSTICAIAVGLIIGLVIIGMTIFGAFLLGRM